jgi:hypothetical protein
MRNSDRKSSAILIFIGLLLTAVFAVGLTVSRDPAALLPKHRYDYALESILRLCAEWWIPAGVIGIPMFVISLGISLWRESGAEKKERK